MSALLITCEADLFTCLEARRDPVESIQGHLADYPIMSHRYLADPGAFVYQGRVYLYNSNDDDNDTAGGYTMHSVVCVSSGDLKNWTDHGIVFRVPADASWAKYSWAPQPLAAANGKVLLYFGNNTSGIGVASSATPTGEFKDAKSGYLVNGSTPGASSSWLFDPGVMTDDDGQSYLSFGGNGVNNPRIIKLGTDLASVSGSAAALSAPGFFEASFLFKRNSLYYFAYSTNPSNGQRIDYMTSSSPMSGYTYRGTIAGQPPNNGNNNQASEFEFNGKWYHAYHNRYVAMQAGISATYRRNLGIEALSFNADGTIQQVSYTTDGVPQIAPLDPYVRVEAETFNAQNGLETEVSSEGGMDVTQIDDGDWLRVRDVDFGTAGAKRFSARVASNGSGGRIELRLGSATGQLAGTCSVPMTSGAQSWSTVTCDVSNATGVKDLYLKFTGSGSSLFNFDYWQFAGGDGGSGGEGGTGGTTGDGGVAGAAAVGGGSNAAAGTSSSSGGSPPGVGGSNASGGRAGTGGTAAAFSGNSGSSGAGTVSGMAGSAAPPPTESGAAPACSCRVGKRRGGGAFIAAFALCLALFRRRQRRAERLQD